MGNTGITGIVLLMAGLTLSLVGNVGLTFPPGTMRALVGSFFLVVAAAFFSIVISFYLSKKILTTHAFGHLALETVQEKEDGYTSADKTYTSMIGKNGIAKTIMRPAGKIMIDDEVYDATAESSYIDKGEEIIVTQYINSQLFVRKVIKS